VRKKVALKDIAKQLGVSAALVSYVLNGKEKEARVSAAMVAKIRKTAEALNYQPNLIAKSLKSGKTNTIGLIVADISNPFFSNIARIIEDEAKKHDYVVLFGSSDESAEIQQDLIDVFVNRLVDAIIIAPAAGTERQIAAIQKKNITVILIDRYFPNLPADCVHLDNFDACAKAVNHLVKNKRSKIAMLAYDTSLAHMQERKEGYKAALRANGFKYKKNWVLQATYQNIQKDVAEQMQLLLEPRQVDALIFATNSLAIAGLKKINELGIKVPEELAIISFDESDAFDFFYSPITYINQSISGIGKEAVQLVINRLNGKAPKRADIVIKPKLIIRESCGSKMKKKK
jgi:LacI family transcriptional regulator